MTLSHRWHKGNQRFYKAYLQKDLFNHWTLICVWGGINSRLGNYKQFAFDSFDNAIDMLDKIKERRKDRGYKLVQDLG